MAQRDAMEATMPSLPPELQELMITAAQYTEVATVLRRKGELDRAVRTMERAVGLLGPPGRWSVACRGSVRSPS